MLDSQELEAAKLQLEQDCYNLRNSLVELQQEHAEVSLVIIAGTIMFDI